MHPLMEASPVTAEILDALPNATDPFALSLNENPFPPLPTVRSALIRSIDVANRYPEFLPERLRRLIARHIEFGRTPADALERATHGSDAANAALVTASRLRADLVVELG